METTDIDNVIYLALIPAYQGDSRVPVPRTNKFWKVKYSKRHDQKITVKNRKRIVFPLYTGESVKMQTLNIETNETRALSALGKRRPPPSKD